MGPKEFYKKLVSNEKDFRNLEIKGNLKNYVDGINYSLRDSDEPINLSNSKLRIIAPEIKLKIKGENVIMNFSAIPYADISNSRFSNSDLQYIKAGYITANGCTFYSTKLNNSDFRHGDFSNSRIAYSDCSNVDFSGASLHDSFIYKSRFYRTRLFDSNLDGIIVEESPLGSAEIQLYTFGMDRKIFADAKTAYEIAKLICNLNCNDETIRKAQRILKKVVEK